MDDFVGDTDVRKKLKLRIIEIQREEMYKRMLLCSKMDKILLNGFMFDGKVKSYLLELSFEQARAIFMVRFSMLPTKANFPGRWDGSLCNACNFEDTDAHLFGCPGYQDLITDDIWYNMFWDETSLSEFDKLGKAADVLISIIERLELIQKMIKSTK